MSTSLNLGKLWVIATPLGNDEDLSPRAHRLLQSVDRILAEDTRRTGRLLAANGIEAPPLTSFHDFNESNKLSGIIELLSHGQQMALVSDAGTPLLSDPGYLLVQACREKEIPVSPVPGPSAVIAALSASGIAPLPFSFLGFPPRKENDIKRFFAPYAHLSTTLIFFERKDRLQMSLKVAFDVLGERSGCIAREITKTHEEFIPFMLSEYAQVCSELLGEITVVLGPPDRTIKSPEQAITLLLIQEQTKGGKPKEIAKRVAELTHGWTAKEVYDLFQTFEP